MISPSPYIGYEEGGILLYFQFTVMLHMLFGNTSFLLQMQLYSESALPCKLPSVTWKYSALTCQYLSCRRKACNPVGSSNSDVQKVSVHTHAAVHLNTGKLILLVACAWTVIFFLIWSFNDSLIHNFCTLFCYTYLHIISLLI